MTPAELMISESQERMLYVTDPVRLDSLRAILEKYEVNYSILGYVSEHSDLLVRKDGNIVAHMPSHLVAHAPLLQWPSRKPSYIEKLASVRKPSQPNDLGKVLLALIANPSIASKRWIFQQYDHEVGIRTVVKPGSADAAVLRLDRDDKLLSIKLDGNSKHCYLDPYRGTLGCLSEGRRNVICTGADPVGFVDHLQFASPADPEVFWTFTRAVDAIIKYCDFMKIPVVGGKVSFYNETSRGPIKPTPVIGTLGLIDGTPTIASSAPKAGERIFVVGTTLPEMGGSEYYEHFHGLTGGTVPDVDLRQDKMNGNAVLRAIREGLVTCAHDCSKGGVGVALAEMAILGETGIKADIGLAPSSCSRLDDLVFSESNSRYLLGTKEPDRLKQFLTAEHVPFAEIGRTCGREIEVTKGKKSLFNISVRTLSDRFYSLEKVMS